MKKIYSIILFLPLFCLAQTTIKRNPKLKKDIEGIGILKIDKTTTSFLDTIANQNQITIREYDKWVGNIVDLENPIGHTKYIIELIKDSLSHFYPADSHSMWQEDVRVFYLNYLNIDGVDIRNIYLEFYKDTLYKFSSESGASNSELSLSEAFEIKYGKPTLDKFTKTPVTCQNGYGAIFNYENWNWYKGWSSIHGRVAADEYSIISYDECKQSSFYSFDIVDVPKEQKVASIELKILNRSDDLKKKKKRATLKDF